MSLMSCARAWTSSSSLYIASIQRRALAVKVCVPKQQYQKQPRQSLLQFPTISSLSTFSTDRIVSRNRYELKSSSSWDDYPIQRNNDSTTSDVFLAGDPVLVEVITFGPLGASVDIIARGHAETDIVIHGEESESALGRGLISQREIAYFRASRNHVDVVRGEVLPAYVESVRPDDGKLSIALRAFGGKAKADEVGQQILTRLEESIDGMLPVGDKSTPEEIAYEFPGVSKLSFKKALAALYKQQLVQPGRDSITLLQKQQEPEEDDDEEEQPPRRARSSTPKRSQPRQQQQLQPQSEHEEEEQPPRRARPSTTKQSQPRQQQRLQPQSEHEEEEQPPRRPRSSTPKQSQPRQHQQLQPQSQQQQRQRQRPPKSKGEEQEPSQQKRQSRSRPNVSKQAGGSSRSPQSRPSAKRIPPTSRMP